MTQFIYHGAGNSEAQQKIALAFMLAQDSTGIATDGVLAGLGVAQTTTASASVVVGKGAGAAQDTLLGGVGMPVLDTDLTLDVLGANPMGGVPRNDLVVFDTATISSGSGGVRVVVGTPNAVPTDPAIPATAVALARLRHAASATTVPSSVIDDLRVYTGLAGTRDIASGTLPLASAYQAHPTFGTPSYRVTADGVVHLSGAILRTTAAGTSTAAAGGLLAVTTTLPAAITPARTAAGLAYTNTTEKPRWMIQSGVLNMTYLASTTITANTWYVALDDISYSLT